jgi:carbonic anhydrase
MTERDRVVGLDRAVADARRYAAGNRVDGLSASPVMHIAFLACMDSRIDIFTMFGLAIGDAHVVRNAGGIVTDDAIRSLAISQRMLGTRTIVIVQHTGCGLIGVDDEKFAADLEHETGARPDWRAGGFDDVEQSVRHSIRALCASPFVPHSDRILGFVYDLEGAELVEVDAG